MIYEVTLRVSADRLGRVFDLIRGSAKVVSMVPVPRSVLTSRATRRTYENVQELREALDATLEKK